MDCCYFLDSRFRGKDTFQPSSPARAAASCFIRLKCYPYTKYVHNMPEVVGLRASAKT